MAEKGEERIYNIPLRSVWLKQTRIQRTNRAVSHIRAFLLRHMHAEKVKVSQPLNEFLWRRGVKKPPAYVKVKVKLEDGVATARLPEEKEIEKVKEKKGARGLKEMAKGMISKKPQETGKPKAPKTKDEAKTSSSKRPENTKK